MPGSRGGSRRARRRDRLCRSRSTRAALAVDFIDRVARSRAVTLDGVLTPEQVAGVRASAAMMMERGRMIELGQHGRDDAVAVLVVDAH